MKTPPMLPVSLCLRAPRGPGRVIVLPVGMAGIPASSSGLFVQQFSAVLSESGAVTRRAAGRAFFVARGSETHPLIQSDRSGWNYGLSLRCTCQQVRWAERPEGGCRRGIRGCVTGPPPSSTQANSPGASGNLCGVLIWFLWFHFDFWVLSEREWFALLCSLSSLIKCKRDVWGDLVSGDLLVVTATGS